MATTTHPSQKPCIWKIIKLIFGQTYSNDNNVYSGLSSAPSSWAVINLDRQSRALIAKGSELCLIDQGGQYQVQVHVP